LSRDSLFRYVENLNSGVEENFNHTTHLFGKVYDVSAEKWRDLMSAKHVTGGLALKMDALCRTPPPPVTHWLCVMFPGTDRIYRG
jgi:hypothetical protein